MPSLYVTNNNATNCTYGEVGLESGDLLSEGNILLLELRLEGSLSISLIVQGLELLLSDFGLWKRGGGGEQGIIV